MECRAVITDRKLWLCCCIWTGILIAANYQYGIEQTRIKAMDSRFYQFLALFGVYCCAFVVPYCFVIIFGRGQVRTSPVFWWLVWAAPALFALKVSIINPLHFFVTGVWGDYWIAVTTLPFKFLAVTMFLVILYRMLPAQSGFWGVTLRNIQWGPYLMMLAGMIPLIVFASTQADFLSAYPRLKQITFITSYTDYFPVLGLLYEVSYGIDFVTIELFFRGFLIFAFARYVGIAAIWPMAVFYCSIHFGKPVLECISSFFGGLVLGIIAYRTRSIIGGLAVHLGIAWMMELGGYLGNNLLRVI